MSQNTSYSDDNNNKLISPFNFNILEEIKKVPSSPELTSKYSKNCPKNIIKKNFYKENEKEKIRKNKEKGKTKEEETKYYDNILKILSESFTSENFNTSDIDKGKEEKIETEKMKIIQKIKKKIKKKKIKIIIIF